MAHPLAPSPADRGSDRPCVGPDRIHPATRDKRRLPTAPIDLTAWLRIPGIAAGVSVVVELGKWWRGRRVQLCSGL